MRYNKIDPFDVCNGKGIGCSLFVQGCPIHCKGCFNQETWDFNGGKEFTADTELYLYSIIEKPFIKRVSILGGEPLAKENFEDVLDLMKRIKFLFPNKQIWLYSGFTYEQILNSDKKRIIEAIDYLVAGPFIEEQKDLTLEFRGSSNQEIIRCFNIMKQ